MIAADVQLGAGVVIHHPDLANLYGSRILPETRIGSGQLPAGLTLGGGRRKEPLISSIRSMLFTVVYLAATVGDVCAGLPQDFQDTLVASGLSQPAGLAFAPDGRLFVVDKTGTLRVAKNGVLLATPFVDVRELLAPPLTFDEYIERGLLGVAFDPAFPDVPFVYIYYSVCKVPGPDVCQDAKNRVARVTAGYQGDPDRADPASQVVLLDDIGSDSGMHNGGWVGFGPLDGKLYVSVGDGGADHAKAQDLASLNGKILRLERDGSTPPDNPFLGVAGARPEIWALGLRNPWRCRFHPDGRLFCGDVGEALWEELDRITAGGNYGWPVTEGDFDPATYPSFVRPIYTYDHATGGSISVGDFGSETNFPGDYQQSFFFGDYSSQWIKRVVLAPDGVSVVSVSDFESPANGITDLVAGSDGALYYTDLLGGAIRRIAATAANRPPVANATATPSAGGAPLLVQFSSAGSSDADGDPLTMVWDFGDGSPTSTETAPSHTYTDPGAYTATLTVSDGHAPVPGTDAVQLAITVGTPPVVTIDAPTADLRYEGGQTIAIAGSATDAEDGPLPATALHWEIRFHHAAHWHPYVNDLVGSPQSFVTNTTGETSADVSYWVILRATDSTGLTSEAQLFVPPRTAIIRLETSPPGLGLTLDGQPVTAPVQVTGVVGVVRTIGADSPQGPYTFAGWSDGGVQVHTISTPELDTTYTASFDGGTATTIAPATTTTAAVSTTTSSTVVTTSPSTTSTTSTSVARSSTTSTSSITLETTSTTADTSSSTTSSTTVTSSSTPATTLPPACPPTHTTDAVGCKIDELSSTMRDAAPSLGRLAPRLERRARRAEAALQRAAELCEAGRLWDARAALRGLRRQLLAVVAKVRSRSGRQVIPPEVAGELDGLARAAADEVKILRDGLTCGGAVPGRRNGL